MRKIKMGMVGGGQGAFIGAVHRMAAALDGQIELVCGAFSSNAERSKASGEELYLSPHRVYATYQELFEKEAKLPLGERMDFVAIVTPNHVHYPVASAALKAGFHVMSDKPATFTVEEAEKLAQEVKESGFLYGLTHNYTGYPMVKEAKHMVASGAIGLVRKVVAEYPQGWLSTHLEASGQKQAEWRTDPNRSGISGCMGDIGSHAENLLEYITGLKITDVCADLSTFVDGRLLDDDGNVLIHLEGGAKGVLYASQISAGDENGPQVRVYGERGSVSWDQLNPNKLVVKWLDKPMQILTPGANYGYYCEATQHSTRLPAGHPEGYLEAFANLYKNFAEQIRHKENGTDIPEAALDVPTIEDGVRGMKFIKAVVESSRQRAWIKL